jgi:hypothetical protein
MRSRSPSVCLLTTFAVGAAAALLSGCPDREVTEVPPVATSEEQLIFPAEPRKKVDMLFVIDDSKSMAEEQDRLTAAFEEMLRPLQELPAGAPSLHIGVISTDVGAPNVCTGNGGKRGELQRPSACTQMHEAFLSQETDAGGVEHQNFDGDIDVAFKCMASLGDAGCGIEQPLQALRLALDPENHANDNFFREDAVLAIVFLTDEDDCSTYNDDFYDLDESVLGPVSSFRCFEYGITCDPVDDARADGPRTNCHPNDESDYLTPVSDFVAVVNRAKASSDQILVAAITGILVDPITVERDTPQNPADPRVADSCDATPDPDNVLDGADAPIRLAAFMDGFEEHQQIRTSLCDPVLNDAVRQIGESIGATLDQRCITGVPTDIDPATPGLQVECVVTEVQHPHSDEEDQRRLPICDNSDDPNASGTLPCYRIVEDPTCDTPTHLEFEVYYPEATTLPPNTIIDARCLRQS